MKQNKKDQKQQRLERNRERHQKLQLYRQHNGTKFLSFSITDSKCQWTKHSNQKTQGIKMVRIQDPSICCLQETHFRPKHTCRLKVRGWRGAWVAQSIGHQSTGHLTSAQVMISPFMISSPELGYVLTAQSLEPASDFVSPSLFAPLQLVLCLSLKHK